MLLATKPAAPETERPSPSSGASGPSPTRELLAPAFGAVPLATADPRIAALAFAAFLIAGLIDRRKHPSIATLPLGRIALPALPLLAAAVAIAAISPLVLGGAVPLALLLTGTGLAMLTTLLLGLHDDVHAATAVLVLGSGTEARELDRTVREVGARRFRVVAATDSLLELDALLASSGAGLIVYTDHLARPAVLGHLAATMRTQPIRAMHHNRFCETVLGVVPLDSVGVAWLAELADPSRHALESRASRLLDVVVSSLLLIPTLPLLLLLAPLIAADGERSVFFRQDRVGRNGRPFRILKLRTMTGTGSDWSSPDDPRVTRIGAILRKTHIDELPQLLNVLKGDMALVGPRPEQVRISEELATEIPLFPYRHLVRPGITGWARVRCGYARTAEESALKLGNDLFYIKHRSLFLDLAILLETLRLTLFEKQFEVRAPAAHYVLGRRPHSAG
ncbi:MAG: sugar transferase [Patulibacter sp.]|nr:sugar transferase [Patulibacter sp.]